MTEKRFTSQRTDDYNFSDILDNGKWIGICHVDCEDDFVNKFNSLHEENQHLRQILDLGKTDAKSVVDVLNTQQKKIRTVSKENQQLRDLILHMGYTIKNENGNITLELKQ